MNENSPTGLTTQQTGQETYPPLAVTSPTPTQPLLIQLKRLSVPLTSPIPTDARERLLISLTRLSCSHSTSWSSDFSLSSCASLLLAGWSERSRDTLEFRAKKVMIQSWTLGIQDSGQLQGGCTLSIIVESDVLMRDRK